MITATGLELRVGARLLLGDATFRIAPGDRVGLVGRNGAGKTTLTRVLAGESQPAAGTVTRSGPVGYLPQDPRTGDLARAGAGPDPLRSRARRGHPADARQPRARWRQRRPGRRRDEAMRRYGRLEERVPGARRVRGRERGRRDRVLARPAGPSAAASRCARCPAASAAASSWPASCSRAPGRSHSPARRADQPPRRRLDRVAARLPAQPPRRSGRHQPRRRPARARVNRVFHLDANRAELDLYNVGWTAYLQQRETDERRRKRERANVEKQAVGPQGAGRPDARQGDQGASAAQSMDRRAARLLSGLEEVRAQRPGGQAALPGPAPCGKHAADGGGAVEVLRIAGGLHRRGPRDRPGHPGGHPRAQRRRQDHAAAPARRGRGRRTPARSSPVTVCGIGYYAQEHETLDPTARCSRTCASAAPDATEVELRKVLGAFLFSGDDRPPAGRDPLRRGEDPSRARQPRRVSAPTCCCSTSRRTTSTRPAARRSSGRCAPYAGAVVLVTHDEGAVEALAPGAGDPAAGRRRGPLERRPTPTSSRSPDPAGPAGVDHVKHAAGTSRGMHAWRGVRTRFTWSIGTPRPEGEIGSALWRTDGDHGAGPDRLRRLAWPN